MSRHDDLGAARVDLLDDALDLARRAGIEVRRGLVEEQHLGRKRPRARERELLLLAARQHACGTLARGRAPRRRELRARAARARRAATPASLSPYVTLPKAARRSITGR